MEILLQLALILALICAPGALMVMVILLFDPS
jgi:hypothetical protein